MPLGVGLCLLLAPAFLSETVGCVAFAKPHDYFDTMCKFTIAFDPEEDGRFIAEVQEIPGALAYGATQAEAKARVQAIALHSLAERIEHGEDGPAPDYIIWGAVV